MPLRTANAKPNVEQQAKPSPYESQTGGIMKSSKITAKTPGGKSSQNIPSSKNNKNTGDDKFDGDDVYAKCLKDANLFGDGGGSKLTKKPTLGGKTSKVEKNATYGMEKFIDEGEYEAPVFISIF